MREHSLLISGAAILSPGKYLPAGAVCIERGRFAAIGAAPTADSSVRIDAAGMTALPGLINAHDHFRGAWRPRAGTPPYETVYQWLDELHARPSAFESARQRDLIDDATLYQLGAYRNLFAGVTTAFDHYYRVDPRIYRDLPVRVLAEYGRESVMRALEEPQRYAPWGGGVAAEVELARRRGLPFVVHVAEGFDERTRGEFDQYVALGLLCENSVLVHCAGIRDGDAERIARAGASIVWCPATYDFLYRRSGNLRHWLELGVNVALGTDSALTGGYNLIEEIQIARRSHREWFGNELDSGTLFLMLTANAAQVLRRQHDLGRIERGYRADLLLLNSASGDAGEAAELLARFGTADIDLLLRDGRPLLGAARHEALFGEFYADGDYSRVEIGGRRMFVAGRPAELLTRVRAAIGDDFAPEFLPFA